jgi:hypothetical protein
VGPPNEAPAEEKAQDEGRRKRPSTCLAESGGMGARTCQRGNATGCCSSVQEDGGVLYEEDSDPSLVTVNCLTGSSSSQAFVQEEAAPENKGMGARTNQRGTATGSCSSVEEDGGGRVEGLVDDKEDSNPSLVASCTLMGTSPSQELVQAEAPGQIPSGWTRVKLEPDC